MLGFVAVLLSPTYGSAGACKSVVLSAVKTNAMEGETVDKKSPARGRAKLLSSSGGQFMPIQLGRAREMKGT